MREREHWQERGRPCWSEFFSVAFLNLLSLPVLVSLPARANESLTTSASQRGRGAAGMLVTWGAQQAEAEGVPAYLEASVLGKVSSLCIV